ncbi:TPA: hypothetical protein RTF98_000698 [Campylobacter jejuni]|nr:hypothetical protein [Campylobacter jejuni]HDZ5072897.1 hypothetical protein [Campylobacter jejuni]
MDFLNLALEFDSNNSACRILLMDEFFHQKQISRVEKYLEIIINERMEEFCETLLYCFKCV